MNNYIDIAISLILIFSLFSIIVYVIQELVAVNLEYRSSMLWRALAKALDNAAFKDKRPLGKGGLRKTDADTPLTHLFYNHPQIKSLQKTDQTKPFYIPAENAALALIDLIAQNAETPTGNFLTDFTSGLKVLESKYGPAIKGFLPDLKATEPSNPAPPIVAVLLSIQKVSGTIDELKENIEKRYKEYMNRVSGWYRSHTVVTVRIIAVAVTIFFNLNTIMLVKDIAGNSTLRSNLNNIAQGVTAHPESITGLYDKRFEDEADSIRKQFQPQLEQAKDAEDKANLQASLDKKLTDAATKYTDLRIRTVATLTDTLSKVQLPIGWTGAVWEKETHIGGTEWGKAGNILLLLIGWLITAGCLSMGAPFWFNLLVQFVNIRSAGVKPGGDKKK